jgi:hypothetical protein
MSTPALSPVRIDKQPEFSRRDLIVLAAIRDCGFIRADQLVAVIRQRGIPCPRNRKVYDFTTRLSKLGLIALHQRALMGNLGVYAVTNEGHAMLRECGYGLECDANAHSDPAGVPHFVALTDMMLRFYREYKVGYWLTDFVVRSENVGRGASGLAKDYDAVAEVQLDNAPLTIAIEYERTLKNRARYRELAATYLADKYVQIVLCLLDSHKWVAPVAEAFTVPGRRLCFVNYEQFRASSFAATRAIRWNGNNIESVSLSQVLQEAAQNDSKAYLPIYNPPQ